MRMCRGILKIAPAAALVAFALLAAAPRAGAAQAVQVVTVRATDFRFDAPASVPAGTVSFRLQTTARKCTTSGSSSSRTARRSPTSSPPWTPRT